jgi:hypothetical protein
MSYIRFFEIILCEILFLIFVVIFGLFLTSFWFSDKTSLFDWIPNARLAFLTILIIYFSFVLVGLKLKAIILRKFNLNQKISRFILILDLLIISIVISPTFLVFIKTLITGSKP